jgi:hypothetical protein
MKLMVQIQQRLTPDYAGQTIITKAHALIDYALAGGLLVLPALLCLNLCAKMIYIGEAAISPYIAISRFDNPVN